MMKELALIGFGWLGKTLGKQLLAANYKVLGTTTSQDKLAALKSEGFHARLLNLNGEVDEEAFKAFFANSEICVLSIPPGKTMFQTYQSQCLKLISLFPKHTKFIFTSATSVYSDKISLAYEDSSVLSDFNFTSQLFLTEKALKSELGDRLTVLRLAGLFDDDRNPAKFLSGKKDLNNPASPVNLVHRTDVLAFILELIRQDCWGETFNVCSSEHPSRKEFYTWMCERKKMEIPHFGEETEVHKMISNEKGKRILNFSYTFDSPFDF